jgi:hypothetical protein
MSIMKIVRRYTEIGCLSINDIRLECATGDIFNVKCVQGHLAKSPKHKLAKVSGFGCSIFETRGVNGIKIFPF